ncbi:hypothetical protein BDN70DRAFT_689934 [Pholiota conissans]|uniref:Uncharacterized protein n=1 Tax=Pholiota conissans TaxID=109636 RepID=A0A9P5Z4S9_9AGAR|nr:hypothetical protein BDN70DRAFT_689934 [Pholiota conissans]
MGCGVSLTHNQAIRLGAAWSGMLGFDALVFGMTLYKSLKLVREPGVNLLSVLLRDGSIYFAVMMASNLGNILTFVFGGPFMRGVATTFTNVISSIMISRLMLNLRDPALVRHVSKSLVRGPRAHQYAGPGSYGNTIGGDGSSTYLTFVSEPVVYSTVQTPQCDLNWAEASQDGRHTRRYYDYLATGSSNRIKKARDIEMVAMNADHGR